MQCPSPFHIDRSILLVILHFDGIEMLFYEQFHWTGIFSNRGKFFSRPGGIFVV